MTGNSGGFGKRRLAVAGIATLAALAVGAAIRWPAHQYVVSYNLGVQSVSSDVVSPVQGRVVQVFVQPGQSVRKGQLLATLDATALQSQLGTAEKELKDAQGQNSSTQAAILPPSLPGLAPAGPMAPMPAKPLPTIPKVDPLATLKQQSLVASAKLKLSQAQILLIKQQTLQRQADDKVQQTQSELTTAQQEATNSRSSLDSLNANLDAATKQRDKFKGYYTEGIISRKEFESKQADVDAAQTALDDAKKQIQDSDDSVTEKSKTLDTWRQALAPAADSVKAVQLQVQGAQAALKVAISTSQQMAKLNVTLPPKPVLPPAHSAPLGPPAPGLTPVRVEFSPVQHEKTQDEVAKAQAKVDELQREIGQCRILSPVDGVVKSLAAFPSFVVNKNQSVMQIAGVVNGDPVSTFVALPDAAKVKAGDPVTISFGASKTSMHGRVHEVAFKGAKGAPATVYLTIPGTIEPPMPGPISVRIQTK